MDWNQKENEGGEEVSVESIGRNDIEEEGEEEGSLRWACNAPGGFRRASWIASRWIDAPFEGNSNEWNERNVTPIRLVSSMAADAADSSGGIISELEWNQVESDWMSMASR